MANMEEVFRSLNTQMNQIATNLSYNNLVLEVSPYTGESSDFQRWIKDGGLNGVTYRDSTGRERVVSPDLESVVVLEDFFLMSENRIMEIVEREGISNIHM